MFIFDVHAHIFPEKVALRAAESIIDFYAYDHQALRGGSPEHLLKEFDDAGIWGGCVHSAAVTPKMTARINQFISETVHQHGDRLIGYGTIHPDNENIEEIVDSLASLGLQGIKLHPDMQHFALDDPKTMKMFEVIEGRFPVLIHTGDYRYDYSHPHQMRTVIDAFPKLTCICAHLGGWGEYDEGWRCLADCENVWIDTSSSVFATGPDLAREVIRKYDINKVLFGTDFPVWTPKKEIALLETLHLTDDEMEKILGLNAKAFFRLR